MKRKIENDLGNVDFFGNGPNKPKQKQMSVQDRFLNKVKNEKQEVIINCVNGFKFKGFIKEFDNFTINIPYRKKDQIVYKSVISSIIVSGPDE